MNWPTTSGWGTASRNERPAAQGGDPVSGVDVSRGTSAPRAVSVSGGLVEITAQALREYIASEWTRTNEELKAQEFLDPNDYPAFSVLYGTSAAIKKLARRFGMEEVIDEDA